MTGRHMSAAVVGGPRMCELPESRGDQRNACVLVAPATSDLALVPFERPLGLPLAEIQKKLGDPSSTSFPLGGRRAWRWGRLKSQISSARSASAHTSWALSQAHTLAQTNGLTQRACALHARANTQAYT